MNNLISSTSKDTFEQSPSTLIQTMSIDDFSDAEIMLIDDRPENLHLLIKILTEKNYRVRPVTSGEYAIAAAQLAPPDLILLDIKMPDMDGYQVCQQLKSDQRTQVIPIIFLTVLDEAVDIVKGFELGGVDYIAKPVEAGELLVRIENQLKLRSLQKQLMKKTQQQQTLLSQYEATTVALKESEQKFSKAFHDCPLPITLSTFEDGRYVDVNHQFIQQSGYNRNEIIGKTILDLSPWADEKDRKRLLRKFRIQGYVRGFESVFRVRSGKLIDVRLFLEPIQVKGKTHLLITGEDITQQKLSKQQLAEQAETLTTALETLKKTQADLIRSAKMAALGNMVAGVAHEINTPVGTAIMSASTLQNATQEIIRESTAGEMKRSSFESYLSVAAECSQLMLDNLQRAGDLVLSFKQVAVDQSSVNQRHFSLKPYLQEVINNLSPRLKKTPHRVMLTGDETITLNSYPGEIAQVITNLILNSLIHAYPEAHQPGTLTIHFQQQSDTLRLTYSDDGCGIPPAHQQQIFEPFFTTARNQGSNGLGLHLVYNLVTQKLKGTIDLVDDASPGTTFAITLPLNVNNQSLE